MSLFTRLFRSPPPASTAPFCAGCATRDNEIKYLREHVDSLLDRVVGMAGILEATKDALSPPIIPDHEAASGAPPKSPVLDEAEEIAEEERSQDHLFGEAKRELDSFCKDNDIDPASMADT